MTGYDHMLTQLYRETVNLSDDGRIKERPIYKAIEAVGPDIKAALIQNFKEEPTRAVFLLLNEMGVKTSQLGA